MTEDGIMLDDGEDRALQEALDDEHPAWANYDQVIRDFGPQRPFIHIVNAEARHTSRRSASGSGGCRDTKASARPARRA
jgi:hypothetical protein